MIWFFTLAVVGVDQLTKLWAAQHGWSSLNPGISFGWLSQVSGSWLTVILVLVGLGMTRLVWRMSRSPQVARGLLLGGVISNLIDRILLGGVRDWLPVPILGVRNNLADYAIAVGVIWLVSHYLMTFESADHE
jgi:signal peptidase II